jgi:NAD(P)-dependent dehydrogenase (short-subunit alcohol dehydrogenase family)
MTYRDFAGKVVLISGGAGGLGTALCRRFAAAGARVVALDLDQESLDRLVAGLGRADAAGIACDIADEAQCRSVIDDIVHGFGGIDVLINNAGITQRSLLADTDPTVIRRVMEVNFFGALHLTHAALPQILARRGAIAAISSVAGFAPLIGRSGYAASKHALHGFFDSLRTEVEDRGVTVTLVCPSYIRTGIDAAALNARGPRLTTGGEAAPEDIAARIHDAMAAGQRLLLPDRTSRLAWWASRLAPDFYAQGMKRRVGAEFADAQSRSKEIR